MPVVLELRGLVKHYHVGEGDPVRAVDGVSLSIASGEFVALYGPSGSGKSTLLNLIAALLEPDHGEVLVNGVDVAALPYKDACEYRLREVGIIGQPSDLLPGARAIQNASLKLWVTHARDARRRVEPLLKRLGLGERMQHRTEQLSMGERQRVLIAQALATDPGLVLADEPTGQAASFAASSWNLQGAERVGAEAPGLEAGREEEAAKAACKASPGACDPEGIMTGLEAKHFAEYWDGEAKHIEDIGATECAESIKGVIFPLCMGAYDAKHEGEIHEDEELADKLEWCYE